MTTDQKRKVLERIVKVEADVEELKRVRQELVSNGYASASLASGGGSKSYTRLDVSKVSETIMQLSAELKSLRSLLSGRSPALPSQIITVYA